MQNIIRDYHEDHDFDGECFISEEEVDEIMQKIKDACMGVGDNCVVCKKGTKFEYNEKYGFWYDVENVGAEQGQTWAKRHLE